MNGKTLAFTLLCPPYGNSNQAGNSSPLSTTLETQRMAKEKNVGVTILLLDTAFYSRAGWQVILRREC